jgi:formamidopyrimidine-DNA glycosylase
MPELPEVESIVRDLRESVSGRTIVRARLRRRDLYKKDSRPLADVAGSEFTGVRRLGKAILFTLAPPETTLVIHLGMTGNLRYEVVPVPPKRREHRHAVVDMDDGSRLVYTDPRRFGFFWIGPAVAASERLGIGPDPFQLGARELRMRLENRSAGIKSLLLNQRVISGLGNIYAAEILFYAGIHPLVPGHLAGRRAGRLIQQARAVLRRAIRYGGTTIRDYRRADGTPGAFQRRLAVYGREGRRCVRCATPIRRIVVNARSTYFCPRCQPLE